MPNGIIARFTCFSYIIYNNSITSQRKLYNSVGRRRVRVQTPD